MVSNYFFHALVIFTCKQSRRNCTWQICCCLSMHRLFQYFQVFKVNKETIIVLFLVFSGI